MHVFLFLRISRSPIDCSLTEQDSSNSPTYFYTNDEGVASNASPPYLCTSEESVNSGSPLTDSSTTIEEETGSPDSGRMNQPWSDYDERSPLGDGLEDVNVNNFVEDLLCGIDDGSGLVTVGECRFLQYLKSIKLQQLQCKTYPLKQN